MDQPAVLKERSNPDAATMRRREKGSGLVLALFAMVLLTGVGVVLLSVMHTEIKMNQVDQRTKKAFYLAEAGVQHGREILRQRRLTEGAKMIDDELAKARGANATIDVVPSSIRPLYNNAGSFIGLSGPGLSGPGKDTPLVGKTALGDGFYYAFLTNDPIDGRSVAKDTDKDERAVLVGVGVGPNRSFEVVENVVQVSNIIPTFPATITMLGDDPIMHPGKSKAKGLSGDDCDDPSVWKPVVGVVGPDAVGDVTGNFDKSDKVTDTMVTGPGGKVTGANTVQDIDASIDQGWKECENLLALGEYVKAGADYIGDGPATSGADLGTPGAPKTVYINGDLTLPGGQTYAGMLWVTGTLIIKGNVTWHGAILVVGEGKVVVDGGGTAKFLGANVVANTAGPDGIPGNADDCTGGYGQAVWDWSGGGNHTTQYCLREINNSLLRLPLRPLDFRQH